MVEIEIVAFKYPTAVLAGIFVTLKDIVSSELDFLFWKTIEDGQKDYLRDTDSEGDRSDKILGFSVFGERLPSIKVKCLKLAIG